MKGLFVYGFVLIVLLSIKPNDVDAHWKNIFKPDAWSRAFKRLSCRAVHNKVVLDKNGKTVGCTRKCSKGYDEKYSTRYGHYCKPQNYPSGCADKYCARCRPFFYLVTTGYRRQCLTTCPDGYVKNQMIGKCLKCFVRNCHSCDGSVNKCRKCKRTYALEKSSVFQTRCVLRCRRGFKKSFKNGVSECVKRKTTPDKSVIITTITDLINNKTEETPEGCKDHACITCKNGYFRFIQQTGGNTCLQKCPHAYTELGTMCMPCSDRRCASCKRSIGECDKCFPGFSMLYDAMNRTVECVRYCPKGYFKTSLNGTDSCRTISKNKNIPQGCTDHTCVTCVNGYFRFIQQTGGNVCLQKCPSGYTGVANMCAACADRRCASCSKSIGECDKCFPGFSMLYDARNRTVECVRYCPNDYSKKFVNGVEICMKKTSEECPVANCKKCVSDRLHGLHKGCEECDEEFALYRSTFNDICYEVCPAQYYRTKETSTNITYCAKCEVAFCQFCDEKNYCSECIEPMVLDVNTGKCKVCDAFFSYSFTEKKCVPADLNVPESGAFL